MPMQGNHPSAPAVIRTPFLNGILQHVVPAAKTASFNGTRIDRNVAAGLEQMFAVLNVGAVTGTTPTLDVVIQESTDNSTWTTLASFTQVTASNSIEKIPFTRSKRYIRISATIAGTTPSFTMTVEVGY